MLIYAMGVAKLFTRNTNRKEVAMAIMTPEQKEKAKAAGVLAEVMADFTPQTKHQDEANKAVIKAFGNWNQAQKDYSKKAQGDAQLDAELTKALNESRDAYETSLKAQVAAPEKDAKAGAETIDALIDAAVAQEKGKDLGEDVWGADAKEFLKISGKVDAMQNLMAFQDNKPQHQQGEYKEAMDIFVKDWHYRGLHDNTISLAGGGHYDREFDILPEWLLSDKDMAAVNKAADRRKFAAAATTHASFPLSTSQATGGEVRMNAILERLFPRSIMATLGARLQTIGGQTGGMVQLSVATAGATPEGRDEEGQDPEEAMTFRSHNQQLRRISATVAHTRESQLFVPQSVGVTRRDIMRALNNALDRTIVEGNEPSHFEGLLYAASGATVGGVAPRAAADRIATGAADVNISGAAGAARLGTMIGLPYIALSGSFGNVIDDISATSEEDLSILLPTDVANAYRGQYNANTDATAMDLIRRRGTNVQGTTHIKSAVAASPADYYDAKKTFGFITREPNPAAVGNIAMFPMMRLMIDNTTKQDRAVTRYSVGMFVAIYMGLRPSSIAQVTFQVIA